MIDTEQSEKDMIGSLLDDDSSDFRSSKTRSQVEQKEKSEQLEFPSQDPQNFYFNVPQAQTVARPHSMSQEYNFYCMQYYPQQDAFFSQKRTRRPPVEQDSVVWQCQDQYASLQVQQSFVSGRKDQKEKIFKQLEDDFVMLSKHKFGNYVIQKIIETGDARMCSVIFTAISTDLIGMCCDKFGCRVVQKLVEFMHDRSLFIQIIQRATYQLIFDQCGNHVIQKMIELLPEAIYIVDLIRDNAEQIVLHPYGCRIAQKTLETFPRESLQQLMDNLIPLIDRLCFCQYGNYIVQHMIPNPAVGAFIQGNLMLVSLDKYARQQYIQSSNVAQRHIAITSEEDIAFICNAIDSQKLQILINNQFGNYIVQTLYTRCSEKHRNIIIAQVRKFDESLFTQYGRHFLQFIARI